MRRVFVGDIHGCLDALERLLELTEFRPGTDLLLPVGDLVNKGPDSIGVLRRAVELGAEAVIGNHDLLWLETGRIADPALRAWLASQPLVRIFDDVLMIHAGLHPHWTDAQLREFERTRPAEVDVEYAVNVRYCTPSGERPARDWPAPELPFRPWDDYYAGERTVVFGHWARRGFDRTERTIALDSACVYGGLLTAWIAEEDRVVSVPASS